MGRFWDQFPSWDEAEQAWEERACLAQEQVPLKALKTMPTTSAIAPGEEKFLRWKGLKWLVCGKGGLRFIRLLLLHPFRHLSRYVCSFFNKRPYRNDDDFYLYGLSSFDDVSKLFKRDDTLLLVGFSYCQKPFECPLGRFSSKCAADLDHGVCQQCAIGKAMHTLPSGNTIAVVVPTVRDIGNYVIDAIERYPDRRVFFLITACEMALKMFSDFGNALGVRGIGVRLRGRVCTTMKAFALSERGVKPGLTMMASPTQERLFSVLKLWREKRAKKSS